MFKRRLVAIIFGLAFLFGGSGDFIFVKNAQALNITQNQTNSPADQAPSPDPNASNPAPPVEQKKLQAVAGEDKSVAVSRKVVFDASRSVLVDPNLKTKYNWELGDGTKKEGLDIIHTYERSGFYQVSLTVENGDQKDTDEIIVSVYEDLMILVADQGADKEKINGLQRYANRQGVLMVKIPKESPSTEYSSEDFLLKALLESAEDLKKANVIIVWTGTPNVGLNVLSKFGKQTENVKDFDFNHKGLVVVSEKTFKPLARIAQSAFDVLKPEFLLLIKSSALEAVIDARKAEKVLEEVHRSGVESAQIGVHSERAVKDLRPWNFLSYIVYYLVNKGVSLESVTLILLLPVVASLIAFTRQFVGIKTLGIYVPSLISLTFFIVGLKYGLFIFLVLLVAATLARLILKKFRFLYLPRMALVLTFMAFVILALFVVGAAINRTGVIALSVFPILILVILVEKFVEVQIEKGFKGALVLSLETIIVSIGCYFIINWELLKTFVLAYPEVILLTIVFNILFGRWIGLRVTEYLRFREVAHFLTNKKSKA